MLTCPNKAGGLLPLERLLCTQVRSNSLHPSGDSCTNAASLLHTALQHSPSPGTVLPHLPPTNVQACCTHTQRGLCSSNGACTERAPSVPHSLQRSGTDTFMSSQYVNRSDTTHVAMLHGIPPRTGDAHGLERAPVSRDPHLQNDVGVARAELPVHLPIPFLDLQFLCAETAIEAVEASACNAPLPWAACARQCKHTSIRQISRPGF